LIKIFGTIKKYIEIIALCMIKEKVAIGLVNSRRKKSIYGSEMLTCGEYPDMVKQ
jgi:hypothetical protein